MQDKVFIDSNVLIYAYSEDEPEKKDISLNTLDGSNITLSTQVINEFIWIMNRKFGVGLEKLKILTDIFWLKYETKLIHKSTIERGLDFARQYRYSYWDSLILSSALENDCAILYTEDMQDGQIMENKLRIINPFKEI